MADTALEMPTLPTRKPPRPVEPSLGTGSRLSGTSAAYPQEAPKISYQSSSAAVVIEIDKLYPAEKDSKSNLIRALGLLADAISLLERARVDARTGNLLDADRYVQKFETLLVPLFAQRSIGDGFASTINALHFSLINQHGVPLTFEQLTTIWRVLKELRTSPFVAFNQSLSWVEEFEECELRVDPPILARVIEDSESE